MSDRQTTAKEDLRVAAHFRAEMHDRRSIELKVFTGVVIAVLLIAKEAVAVIQAVEWPLVFRIVVTLTLILLLLVYLAGLVAIEKRNADDRRRYLPLEKRAGGGSQAEADALAKESCWKTIWNSWAATYPFLAVAFITLGVIAVIWILKPW